MLEFYPMPTNLSHGSSLYQHLQNHGGMRYLDNSNLSSAALGNVQCLNNNNNSSNLNNNSNINCSQQMIISPTHASCPPQPNNGKNISNNLPTSVSASSTTSLTAQAFSSTTPTTTTTSASATATATSAGTSGPIQTTPTATVNPNATPASRSCSDSTTCFSSSNPHLTTSSISTSATVSAPTPTATSLPSSSLSSASLSSTSSLPSSGSAMVATSSKLSAAAATAASVVGVAADCSGRTEVGYIKCERNYEICEGCGQKIHDRYLMNIGDTNWHEQCLACCYCGMQLQHTCYVRNTKLYCKMDYDRLFGIKCAACCHPILPQELVMRPIPNFVFHLPCFICFACRLPLQKGEQFMLRDGQLFCFRHDIEKEMFLVAAQHCGFMGLDEEDLLRPRDGRRGPKRPRTILTSQQRKQFKASFDQSPKPCRKVREALAKDTGLSVRVVQVWFQNQRAKMKKIQRKAKNAGSGNGTARSGDDKEKDKDEKNIKQESTSSGDNCYLGVENTFASQPLNPNLPFSPDDYPANSNDSFCSSDLSLDDSNFDQLDDDADSLSLNNLELQSTSSSGNQHSNPHDMIANLSTSLINPIDKLYLMQNSYFNSEH